MGGSRRHAEGSTPTGSQEVAQQQARDALVESKRSHRLGVVRIPFSWGFVRAWEGRAFRELDDARAAKSLPGLPLYVGLQENWFPNHAAGLMDTRSPGGCQGSAPCRMSGWNF